MAVALAVTMLAPLHASVAGASLAVQAAPPPPKAQRSPISNAQRRELLSQRAREETRAWYLADETRDKTLDPEMLALIDMLARQLWGVGMDPECDRMYRTAWLLAAEYEQLPIPQLAIALARQRTGSSGTVLPLHQKALDALLAANAPKVLVCRAAIWAVAFANTRVDREVGRPFAEIWLEQELEQLRSLADSHDQLIITSFRVVTLMESLPVDLATRLRDEALAIDGLDPSLREQILGEYEFAIAWAERGDGFADTVDGEQHRRFRSRLAKASEHLHAAWALDPCRAAIAARLIEIAMAHGTPAAETPIYWFLQAITACPDEREAYDAIAWALRPRWGGSIREMVDLAVLIAEIAPRDTAVPRYALEVLANAVDESDSDPSLLGDDRVAECVLSITQSEIARDPQPSTVATMLTWEAIVHWLRGEHALALATIQQPGFVFDPVVLNQLALDATAITHDAWALGGSVAPAVAAADALARQSDFKAAARAFGDAIEALPSSAPRSLQAALRDRHLCALLESKLAEGNEWIDVPTEQGLPGWRATSGRWRSDRAGRVIGTNGDAPVQLMLAVPLGPRFAVSIEAPDPDNRTLAEVGILWLYHLEASNIAVSSHVLMRPDTGALTIADVRSEEPPTTVEGRATDRGGIGALEVLVWDEWAMVRLGGVVKWVGTAPGGAPGPRDRIAIGSIRHVISGQRVAAEKIRVKRLREMPDELKALERRSP